MKMMHNHIRCPLIVTITLFVVVFTVGCTNQLFSVNEPDSEDDTSGNEVEISVSVTPTNELSRDETGLLDDINVEDANRALFLLWDWHGREYHKWKGRADYYPTRRAPSLDDYVNYSPLQGTPVPDPIVTSHICSFTAMRNVNCRGSDYAESTLISIMMEGENANLLYLNPTYTHGKFELMNNSRCWIPLGFMDGPSDPLKTCNVHVVDAPLPSVDSHSDGSNNPSCSSDLDEASCSAAGGSWVGGATGKPYCDCS
jgi:hypothetical protein